MSSATIPHSGRRHGSVSNVASATPAAIEETKKNIVRRRLFKHLILPMLDAIEDEEEYNAELERAWADFQRLTA